MKINGNTIKKKNWNEAVKFYESKVSDNPKNPEYHFRCGLAYFFLGYERDNVLNDICHSFFSNAAYEYPYPPKPTVLTVKAMDEYEQSKRRDSYEWWNPGLFYDTSEAAKYAVETKTLNGGKKNKLYITYENAFNHFCKALYLLPSWETYFGMGLIYTEFSPLNFWYVSSKTLDGNYSERIHGDESKAEEFLLKSIEAKPNWQSYYACIKKIYSPRFVNTDKINSKERKNWLDFLTTGINLAVSNNAPTHVLKIMYYYRGFFYKKFEKNFDLALKDLQKANSFETDADTRSALAEVEQWIEDEKIAKEKGYKSVEDYRTEKKRLAEIERQKELSIKRKTLDNFYEQVLYESGIPLEKGDTFTISANRLKIVDRVVEAKGYTYLVTLVSSAAENSFDYARTFGVYGGGFRHCFYIVTKVPLNLREQLEFTTSEKYITNSSEIQLVCAGKAKYQRNYQDVDCYIFVANE